GYAEAPMQVVTGGMTADEHLRQQAELSARLNGNLPPSAAGAALEVPFTQEEIDALDFGSRSSVPLRIGLGKAIAPRIDVSGLTIGSGRQATRGATQRASRTSDGGFVWAMPVSALDAGAIRLHIEDLSLPPGAEMYLYSRDGQAHGPYTGDGPNGT